MFPSGTPTDDAARVFIEQLPTMERVLGVIARRNALSRADADEFGSWVRARIIESEYAIFRKFAGRASMPTYLSVVLGNLFHDYRNSVWGRWRPSAAALRLGPVAVRIEELLHRDGYTLRETVEVLRSAGAPLSESALRALAARLPRRQVPSEVPLEAIDASPGAPVSAAPEVAPEADEFAVIHAAVAMLPDEDQVIMRLRFWDDLAVADIARLLQLEQKPLYRRIDAIEARLRSALIASGLDREKARDLLASEVAW